MLRQIVGILLCALVVCFVFGSFAQAQVYVTGPFGNTVVLDSPVHWHSCPHHTYDSVVIYDSAPPVYVYPQVIVGPVEYKHPAHWEHQYDQYGNRYDRWVPEHWSTRPYHGW